MATITQKITNFPTPPDSSNDTPTEFNTKADAFVNHQGNVYTTEVNTWATQANGLKDDMNVIKTDIDNTVASIPAGTINDTTTSTTSVWSSTKTDAEVKALEVISTPHGALAWVTKFSDGMIMFYVANWSSPATSTFNFAYPAGTFIETPSVNVTIVNDSYGYHGITQHSSSNKDKGVFVKYKRSDGSTNTDAIKLNFQAIGRWK